MNPGWYYCQGDPPNTFRYWNGTQWVGAPQYSAPAQPHAVQSSDITLPGIGTLADPGLRLVARLIDIVILGCASYAINSLIGIFAADRAIDGIYTNGFGGVVDAFNTFGVMMVVSIVVAVLLTLAYEVGFTMHFGATPGKLMFGFRVVDERGKTPLDWQPALVRWILFGMLILVARMPIVGFIGALGLLVLSILGLVLILTSPKRQAPWDVLAKTYVVAKNTNAS
ncbi:MAG: RDD family protein [Polyangiales bacterium]